MSEQGDAERPPSAVCARTAAGLALLGSLFWTAAALLIELTKIDAEPKTIERLHILIPLQYGCSATALLLFAGAMLLFSGFRWGRNLVVAMCALILVSHLTGIIIGATEVTSFPTHFPLPSASAALVAMIFPLATLLLASLPATDRWLTEAARLDQLE